MLAPAPPRPGSAPGEADRRRVLRLIVIAVITALLAIAIPVLLAIRSGDTAPAQTGAAGSRVTTPAAPSSASAPVDHSRAVSGGPRFDPSTSAVALPATPESDPATPGSDPATPGSDPATPGSDPATGAADVPAPTGPEPAASTAPQSEAPSSASVPADPGPPAASVESDPPANWMQALRPQVDPEGLATWVFEARGAWGASDGHTVFIDPDVPEDKRWSVMVHEYGHVLQVHHYGSLNATAVAMNAIVGAGPTDKGPTESNADCIAELLGATWTDYGCQDALRPAAAALVGDDPAARSLAARA